MKMNMLLVIRLLMFMQIHIFLFLWTQLEIGYLNRDLFHQLDINVVSNVMVSMFKSNRSNVDVS